MQREASLHNLVNLPPHANVSGGGATILEKKKKEKTLPQHKMQEGGHDVAAIIPVAITVPSSLSHSLSPSLLSVSTPHEQLLAAGCEGVVHADHPTVVVLVPSPQCPYPCCL